MVSNDTQMGYVWICIYGIQLGFDLFLKIISHVFMFQSHESSSLPRCQGHNFSVEARLTLHHSISEEDLGGGQNGGLLGGFCWVKSRDLGGTET